MATLTQGAAPMLSKKSASQHLFPTKEVFPKNPSAVDILCFSHLRWDFVFQRPQHLLTRAAQSARVFYWEEPFFEDVASPSLREREEAGGIVVLQPVLPHGTGSSDVVLRKLLAEFVDAKKLQTYVSWFYTPMALAYTNELEPVATVYDCMDELSAFRGAPPELVHREQELLRLADVVFVGGASLFASKKSFHRNIHLYPSSVEAAHFAQARNEQPDPPDQHGIPHPRVGFYGVLDERLDTDLLAEVADLQPSMHFILLGPTAKISSEDLPKRSNLHYLGAKRYTELPTYLAGWDAAILPFARNEATRFISPTKTPEYLAAWKPVVSTEIRDVVSPYGDKGLVVIANDASTFAAALNAAVQPPPAEWKIEIERMLATNSWDHTWGEMKSLIADSIADQVERQR